ncbi:MAG: Tim44-like domain-containing protein [Oscillospiraceae bacterium]|nr:Tim44-like domain-containing protein [Oscillospiraceae bacterium]
MKKNIAVCFFAALLIAACFILLLPSGAFDGNDYDGGGGGDWGGGDWDSDYSGGGGGDDVSDWIAIIVVIVFVAIVWFFLKNKGEVKSGGGAVRPSSNEGLHIKLPDRTAEIENIIKSRDPNFSAGDFLSFAKRVYIDIQTAWCKRDLTTVRALLHDNLYDATVKQVQAKIEQGVIYHYESMVVNTSYLTSYAGEAQFEYLTIYLNARMIDWQEDEKTGAILRGDKVTRWDLRYKMKFMRSAGVVTKEESAGAVEHRCPNCGAPLAMTSSAKCEYCGAAVTTGQYSWVLSDFGTIRNDTIDDGVKTV